MAFRLGARPAGLQWAASAFRQQSSSARFASTNAYKPSFGQKATSILTSRTSAITLSLLSVGSIAWFSQVYGRLPFITELKAMTEAEEGLHPPSYPWSHAGPLSTFDHASIRRGYQVYREVCSSCHSLNRVAWRTLVGVSHTVDEVKEMSAEFEYPSEPDDNGVIGTRPGKLADYMPNPYPNEQAARAANAGAYPPDLSLMTKARHGGAVNVFSILTGYVDPPAGAKVPSGLNFNPYFPGTGIAMARVLFDGLVEYEDGTPATTSQMAKDVTTFLNWAAEPELDERHLMGLQATIILTTLLAASIWVKRFKWIPIKNRKIVYNPPKV